MWFSVFYASWMQITIFHKNILPCKIKVRKICHISVSKCYYKYSKFNVPKCEAMGQNFERNRNSTKIEFFKDVTPPPIFSPWLRIFVRQILNIYDNTLRPKHDKSYVLLSDRIFMKNYHLHSWGTKNQKSSFVSFERQSSKWNFEACFSR